MHSFLSCIVCYFLVYFTLDLGFPINRLGVLKNPMGSGSDLTLERIAGGNSGGKEPDESQSSVFGGASQFRVQAFSFEYR